MSRGFNQAIWPDGPPMVYADRFVEVIRLAETSNCHSLNPYHTATPVGSGTTVRAGTVADLDALEAIERRAFICNRIARRSFARLVSSSPASLMVADHAGLCIGYAVVLFRSGSQIARLYSIAVDPANIQRGVGTALLRTAEKKAGNRGSTTFRLEVREDNSPALRLYQKFGFRIFGYQRSYYEDGTPALRLQKKLTSLSEREQRASYLNDRGLAIPGGISG
jgi:ribosomal-protein-alanine acetyltransferase